MSDSKLTDKQQLFVVKYLEYGLNATKAAREAGYSAKTARQQGTHLLSNVAIRAAIDAELRKHAMSAEEVLFHLTTIARGDMHHLVDQNGNLDMAKAEANNATNLIRKVRNRVMASDDTEINEGEIEVYDRMDALKTLAKYHQLLTTKIQIDDWRSQAIADIRAGVIPVEAYGELAAQFGTSLAAELFAAAGVQISVGDDTP